MPRTQTTFVLDDRLQAFNQRMNLNRSLLAEMVRAYAVLEELGHSYARASSTIEDCPHPFNAEQPVARVR